MRQPETGAKVNALAGLLLVAVAATAGWALTREIAVRDSQVLLSGGVLAPFDDEAQPRAAIAEALLLAGRAARMPEDPARTALLYRAGRLAAEASNTRLHWGDAWMARAYIAALRQPDGVEAVNALARSYADAPFLRNAADWRIEFGIARWADLDPESRRRLIAEAIVFAQFNPDSRRRVFALARGTDAYHPLAAAWRGIVRERQIELMD